MTPYLNSRASWAPTFPPKKTRDFLRPSPLSVAVPTNATVSGSSRIDASERASSLFSPRTTYKSTVRNTQIPAV